MLILGLKFQIREIIGCLKFRTPKCAFEIIWGLIFLCPHKFTSVQKFLVDKFGVLKKIA